MRADHFVFSSSLMGCGMPLPPVDSAAAAAAGDDPSSAETKNAQTNVYLPRVRGLVEDVRTFLLKCVD